LSEVLLLSGGIDSSALAAWRRPTQTLVIDYGQISAPGEIQSDDSWYLEFNRPPTPGPAAELLAEVRRWLAEERITQTIVWIGEQPFAVSG
jgi:hypothetical protein